MKALLLVQAHRTQGRAYGLLLPGARIAPTSSNWAWCQTHLEKSGAKGANACTILGGRVRTISITSFWLIAVTSVPYPFRSQMAKVELSGPIRNFLDASHGHAAATNEDVGGPCSARRERSRSR